MPIYELDGVAPELPADGDCWVAPGAHVIGNVKLGESDTDPFVGRDMGRGGTRGYSDEVAAAIDDEVRTSVSMAR